MGKAKKRKLMIAAICAGILASCGGDAPVANGRVIARVDDAVLTDRDIAQMDPTGTLTADQIKVISENWIERELLLKIAVRRGITSDSYVQWKIEEARARVILESLGDMIRAEAVTETNTRAVIEREIEEMRTKSRIESAPWNLR